MKYFLDSAKIDEIKEAYETFGIDGVTTNPNHIMASGKPLFTVLEEIKAFIAEKGLEGIERFPVSVEINPHFDNTDDMVEMGRKIAALSQNFAIKIPCTESGVAAARRLENEGIRTTMTLVFSPTQALIAAKNGSLFVAPFIGWKEQTGENCTEYIKEIVEIFANYGYLGNTQIICASVRSAAKIAECAKAGADAVTCSLKTYKESFYHPFTDYGLSKFCSSWDKTVTE